MKSQANMIIISEYKAFIDIFGTVDLKLLQKAFVKVLFMFVLLLCFENSLAQFPPRQKAQQDFSPKVHYYPFYNGVQMIEIDRITPFYQEVAHLEMTQPRALAWEMILGPAPTNSYLFRNEHGQIVKSYGDHDGIQLKKVEASKALIVPHNNWKVMLGRMSLYGGARLNFFPHYAIGNGEEGSVGLIDSLGNITLPQKYHAVYSENEHFITVNNFKHTLLDKDMKPSYSCKDCQLTFYDDYQEGVMVLKGDLRGLISFSGKEVIPCKYDMILPRFHDQGLLEVRLGGRMGLVNWKGEEVLPAEYQSIGEFSFGLLNCRKNELWGYVNAKGETIIPHQFSIAMNFKGGFAKVAIKKVGNYYFGFINTKGEIVVPLEYEKAEELENGMVKVKPYGTERWQTLELAN